MMRQNGIVLGFFAFAGLAVAQTPTTEPKAANPKSVVARIGERTITLEEFNRRFEQNSQLVPGKAPPKAEVLKNIVYFELATLEARRLKLNQDQALREQFDILLYQAIVRRFIQPKIDALEVSEAEVRKYYEDNPLIRSSHIILLTKPGMTEAEIKALRDRANKILEIVRGSNKSFEDLAKQYSEGPSARTGGDVDWGARHKLLPEYYEAALALKNIGDLSPVVETPYGFHIIRLTGRRPFAEIDSVYRDFIIRTIRENKGQTIFSSYFEELKARYKVVTNEELIR
jgi:parvulin-like peptidyl-prolyl isomerase